MGRPARNHETSRLTLDLNTEVRQQLEELRDKTTADSLSAVVRTAIKVYDYILEAQMNGNKIFRVDENGTQHEIVFIL